MTEAPSEAERWLQVCQEQAQALRELAAKIDKLKAENERLSKRLHDAQLIIHRREGK